jgi:hypothetical protein
VVTKRRIRSPNDIAALNVLGETYDTEIKPIDNIWSPAALKKMSKDQLIERLRQVDGQFTIMKWRIWWAIRNKFKSDKLFGQFINELREKPEYAIFIGSQQDINRAYHAGRFCEKWKITDLAESKIPRVAIYELSRPANDDVSDAVYKEIKSSVRRRIQFDEVNRLIEQKKAILTIEQQPEAPIERMEYSGKRFVEVEDGVARDHAVIERPGQKEQEQPVLEDQSHEKQEPAPSIPEASTRAQMFEYPTRGEVAATVTREAETGELSNEQIATEIMLLVGQFNLRWDRMTEIFKLCIAQCRPGMRYPKR